MQLKQKKPYGRAKCELLNYGKSAVMFTASWTDRDTLSPDGWAVIEHARYLSSLSDEALYDAMKTDLFDNGIMKYHGRSLDGDASCHGVITPEFENMNLIGCYLNLPFEQLDPGDLAKLAAYRDHIAKFARFDPATMTGFDYFYGLGLLGYSCGYIC